MSREVGLLLEDIAGACAKVRRYVAGRSSEDVFGDEMRFDAVLFDLQVIGEAIKKLPGDFRQRHPQVAWRAIAGMRDFVAHAYFALDRDILWGAIQGDIPRLHEQVREILASGAAGPTRNETR